MQEPVVTPEPPTESSFVESSFDADPVDAPVTQPPPTMEIKKDKKGKRLHMPRFKKHSEPKEPMEPRQLKERPVEDRVQRVDKGEIDEARQEQIAMDTFKVFCHLLKAISLEV